ncbi:MAG: hypothetical protein JXA90_12330, partial [Planctomycetes bacterium]|nr:hypothetical protein [Planctomycetota bacterium]
MSRTQLIVLTAMAILCCGCLVFIYHHVQSWISTPPGEPFAAFEDAFPEREPMPLEPVEPVEQPPAQPREIEISGRVFGPDLEPLGGGEIVLISGGGAEEIAVAQVDARGAFGFQAALRPRLCGLAYRRDGEPAAVF